MARQCARRWPLLAAALFWGLLDSAEPFAGVQQPRTNKCLMVIGAHADDVEEVVAGGTIVKFVEEGYDFVYVLTTNNTAGCLLNRSLEGTGPFTEAPVPHDYPADALETMEIRTEETIDAAAILGTKPIFLNFWEPEFWPGFREVVYIGDAFFQEYDPPGRQIVSVATRYNDAVDVVADLLETYRPEIVITHMSGGEKHDHGNTGYMVYRAFKRAMERGVVGQLWMRPYGWVEEPLWKERLVPHQVVFDVTPYIARAYKALNAHVSQMDDKFQVESGKKYEERFLIILDAYEEAEAASRPKQK